MAVWYCSSVGWTAATAWAALTTYSVGDLRRQLATPTVGQERVFRCTTGGISGATEPSPWTLTIGGTTNDGTVVWTEVTGNSTYGWTAPHARLANAIANTWAAAGDTVYVSHQHAETQAAAMTLASQGTAAAPVIILCVNAGATPPTALATTATITTTGTSDITFDGFAYIYGIAFNIGTGTGACYANICITSAKAAYHKFSACSINLIATNTNACIKIGYQASKGRVVELVNTTLGFAAVGQYIQLLGTRIYWKNTASAITGSVPTTLFQFSIYGGTNVVEIEGVDLSALGAGKNLVAGSSDVAGVLSLKNCKLGASVTVISAAIVGQGAIKVYLDNCDSADPASGLRTESYEYQGSVISNLASYFTGGATDGLHAYSLNMTTLAGASFFSPLEGRPIAVWNALTGATRTISVNILHSSASTDLTSTDIWLEVQEFITASLPLASVIGGRTQMIPGIQATGTSISAGVQPSTTWTTGISNPRSQVLSVTTGSITEQGYFLVRVMMAKPSYTAYVDPKITVA